MNDDPNKERRVDVDVRCYLQPSTLVWIYVAKQKIWTKGWVHVVDSTKMIVHDVDLRPFAFTNWLEALRAGFILICPD